MSERGVFAVDRGIFGHPVFANEPLTEREAWTWLISQAAWKQRRRRVGNVVVDLDRGQLSHSLRFMAGKWQWSEPRVRRFLNRLKTDAMIDAATDAGVTVITICNYNKYQRVSLPTDAATLDQSDAAPTQHRRKEEDIKNIKIDDDDDGPAPLVSREAINLANEVAVACGHDPEFVPPSWMGAAWTTQKWINEGWSAAAILAACKEAMAKKRDGPPSRIEYFEKPIAQFIARQAAPLPHVEIVKGETVHVVQGFGQQNQRGSLTDAARRLAASFAENRPGDSGATGSNIVRLLPESRRE